MPSASRNAEGEKSTRFTRFRDAVGEQENCDL